MDDGRLGDAIAPGLAVRGGGRSESVIWGDRCEESAGDWAREVGCDCPCAAGGRGEPGADGPAERGAGSGGGGYMREGLADMDLRNV